MPRYEVPVLVTIDAHDPENAYELVDAIVGGLLESSPRVIAWEGRLDGIDEVGDDDKPPTYHGILATICRRCGHRETSRTTLELQNDLDGSCPSCGSAESVLYENADGSKALVEQWTDEQPPALNVIVATVNTEGDSLWAAPATTGAQVPPRMLIVNAIAHARATGSRACSYGDPLGLAVTVSRRYGYRGDSKILDPADVWDVYWTPTPA